MDNPKNHRVLSVQEVMQQLSYDTHLYTQIKNLEKQQKEMKHELKFTLNRDPIRETNFKLSIIAK